MLELAGMQDTSFRLFDLFAHPNLAAPFSEHRNNDELVRGRHTNDDDYANPAGGMISTLSDMARWSELLLNNGVCGSTQIVPISLMKETS